MGAGKSWALGELKKLAQGESLDLDFYDLDEVIFEQNRTPDASELGELIERLGWPKFRELERESLQKLLEESVPKVISLGGGALESFSKAQWQQVIEAHSALLVWIDTSFEVCFQRVQGDKNRPLAALRREELQDMYDQRVKKYAWAQQKLVLNPNSEERARREILDFYQRVIRRNA